MCYKQIAWKHVEVFAPAINTVSHGTSLTHDVQAACTPITRIGWTHQHKGK